MPTPLSSYKSIKDIYCVGYFGESKKIAKELRIAKEALEKQFPGVHIVIALREEFVMKGDIPEYQVLRKVRNKEFAYFREIRGDDCVAKFMEENSNF